MTNANIPTKEQCLDILNTNKTPPNVIEHCKAVCRLAEEIADNLMQKGIEVNKKLVTASSLLHDIERSKNNHVAEGAKLLKSLGFPEVSEVVSKHSLHKVEEPEKEPKTVEEKIVFYADKRVQENKIVSLKERFQDLEKRYSIDLSRELEFAKKIGEGLMQ
ncbi:MAG: HDIG domain-containing protein [Candidatus Woesearchaeota archaeon]|nr:HDIG domain-containing protein [Candidatus Woesearchaeota archaeon]